MPTRLPWQLLLMCSALFSVGCSVGDESRPHESSKAAQEGAVDVEPSASQKFVGQWLAAFELDEQRLRDMLEERGFSKWIITAVVAATKRKLRDADVAFTVHPDGTATSVMRIGESTREYEQTWDVLEDHEDRMRIQRTVKPVDAMSGLETWTMQEFLLDEDVDLLEPFESEATFPDDGTLLLTDPVTSSAPIRPLIFKRVSPEQSAK